MNLMTPSTDLKELQNQNDLFRKLKVEHDLQLKELTRGQAIAQLEAQAKKALDDARLEAQSIIATAKRGAEQIEKTKCDYESMKKKLESVREEVESAKRDALKAKTEAEQLRSEANQVKAKLEIEQRECETMKTALKAKTKQLQDYLVAYSGSIN